MNRHRPLLYPPSIIQPRLPLPQPSPSLPRLTSNHTLLIKPLLSPICNTNIPYLFSHLHPYLTRRRNRTQFTKTPVRPRGHNESGEEIDIVDILRSDGDIPPDCTHEANDVDEDTRDVGCVAAPVEAVPEVIGRGVLRGVEGVDFVVPFSDNVVIADQDAGDGGEEDGVGGEVGGEVVGAAEKVPEGSLLIFFRQM